MRVELVWRADMIFLGKIQKENLEIVVLHHSLYHGRESSCEYENGLGATYTEAHHLPQT
jgi:hypothetical protein